MKNSKKVLLIQAHLFYPSSEGKLNDAFFQIAKSFFIKNGYQVLETKIETAYDIDQEVEKHLEANIVILQTPVNWFSAPWIHKKYVDELFNAGLDSQKLVSDDGRSREDIHKQYGSGGKMQGKKFMICATWNAPAEAFGNPAQQLMKGKTTADLFLSITTNYTFCGYDIVPDYNCFDIYKSGDITKDLENYPLHLEKYFF